MNRPVRLFLLITQFTWLTIFCPGQTPVSHTYETIVNVDYPHGQLPSVFGVHNIQVMRANRENPGWDAAPGWTYNHGADIVYWNNRFYVDYLSNPEGEHKAPGRSCLVTSADGYSWEQPVIVFPAYRIPDGTKKEGVEGIARDLDAVMHQRIGFYISTRTGRLFALGYYGICLTEKDKPNDGKGIGRVIREIRKDGSFGEIFFIRYNHGWNETNTRYPFYNASKERSFRDICEEILADPLITLQWIEENDRNDPIIPRLAENGQAFCWYRLANGNIIGMWKSRLSGISTDGGKTWKTGRTPGLYTASAKMWGQRTSDGSFAQVFNPSIYRWPMAVSVSMNGLEYTNLLLVHGDISPMRYSGREKSYGPQYLRGIHPGNGSPPDGDMWLAYSVNKEDIWVARVMVPVTTAPADHPCEDLAAYSNLSQLKTWNIYSPLWAPVKIAKSPEGKNALLLSDCDRYDYAKAERLIPSTRKLKAEFSVIPGQNDNGLLNIEIQNDQSSAGIRICFDPDGMIRSKRSYKFNDLIPYRHGERYDFTVEADVSNYSCKIIVNGKQLAQDFYAPVKSFSKIVFRTGEMFRIPTPDTPAESQFILESAGEKIPEARYFILRVKTSNLEK